MSVPSFNCFSGEGVHDKLKEIIAARVVKQIASVPQCLTRDRLFVSISGLGILELLLINIELLYHEFVFCVYRI